MNCLLYARVSTDKQAQKDLSIPAQIAAMTQYVKNHGWTVAGHYVDEGESARTADRPELKNLLKFCKDNKSVNIVVVHKLDRFARNLADFAAMKAILKQRDIRLVSVCEAFEDNPVGNLLENIIASISEWYSANLSEEIKKASAVKLSRGEWPGKPPLGYQSIYVEGNRPKHVPDPKIAPVVRQAFELFSTGNYSLQTVAEEMFSRGLQTRSGRMYTREMMKQLYRRKYYIGRLEWSGKEYRGIHDPLISRELFDRVQQVLSHRSTETGDKGKREFLLRGVLYCQVCGEKLTAEVHPRGSYYHCLRDLRNAKCPEPYIPVDMLDLQLETLYAKLQPSKECLALIKLEVDNIAAKRQHYAKRERQQQQQFVDELEQKELNLLDEMLAGTLDRTLYEKMQKKYTQQKTNAEVRLAQMDVDYRDPLDFLDKCMLVVSMLAFLHQRFVYAERRDLLKAIFERIIVREKQIVSVTLNPPFSYLLKGDLENVFDNVVSGGPNTTIFEQLLAFSWTEEYMSSKKLIDGLLKKIDLTRYCEIAA